MRKNQKERCLSSCGRKAPKWLISTSLLLLFFLLVENLSAQKTVSTAGGEAHGNGGKLSYTIGQVADRAYLTTEGVISEGVQQTYEIYVITDVEDASIIDLTVTAYPNPVTDHLMIKVIDVQTSDFFFEMYDVSGSLLQKEKLSGPSIQINMKTRVAATYYVKVFSGSGESQREIKTFKIIKH